MSTNITSFAVPHASDETILSALARGIPELLRVSDESRVAVVLGPGAEDLPLRWFRVLSQGDPSSLEHADFMASMRPHLSTFVSTLHDDRSNVFYYERLSPSGRLSIASIDGRTYADGSLPDRLPPFSYAVELGLAVDFPAEPRSSEITRCAGLWWCLAVDGRPCEPARMDPTGDLHPLDLEVDAIDEMELGDEVAHDEDEDWIDPADDIITEAEAAAEAGEHGTARDLYVRATQISPSDALTHLCLARYAAERGDRDLARDAFRKCLARQPGAVLQLRPPGPLSFLRDEPWISELYESINAGLLFV